MKIKKSVAACAAIQEEAPAHRTIRRSPDTDQSMIASQRVSFLSWMILSRSSIFVRILSTKPSYGRIPLSWVLPIRTREKINTREKPHYTSSALIAPTVAFVVLAYVLAAQPFLSGWVVELLNYNLHLGSRVDESHRSGSPEGVHPTEVRPRTWSHFYLKV